MSAGTKLFLLLGCLVVIALEAPATLASLAAGWRGPYPRPALAHRPPAGTPALELGLLAEPLLPPLGPMQVARR